MAPRGHVWPPVASGCQRRTVAPLCTKLLSKTIPGVCHEDSHTRGHVWLPGANCGPQGPLGALGALLPHYAHCCPIMHQKCLKHCSGVCHEESHTRGHVWLPGAMCGPQGPLGAIGTLLPHYAPNLSQTLFQGSAMKIVTPGAMCGSQGPCVAPRGLWVP